MQIYKNDRGDSGIAAFALGRQSITIRFKTGGTYLYNFSKPGSIHVENMKRLALAGDGLTTYINQKVRNNYAERLD